MSFHPLIIVLLLLGAGILLLFIRWRYDVYCLQKHDDSLEIKDIIIDSAMGGYYFWQPGHNEKFSLNLVNILGLQKRVKDFKELVQIFSTEKETLLEMVERLKTGKQEHFLLNCKRKTIEGSQNLQCTGYRIEDGHGETKGVIVWFYDVSSFNNRIKDLFAQSNRLKHEAGEYINILNSIPIPVWWRDKDFSIGHFNLAYGKVVNDNVTSDGSNEVAELDKELRRLSQSYFKSRRPLTMKKHMVVNGERRYFQITENAVANGEGVIGYAIDISKEEDIEKELQRHISAHADLLESSSSAMAIYGPDTRLKFYNQAFAKLWGLDETWLGSNPTYSEVLERLREERKLPEQADFKSFRKEQVQLFKELIDPRDEFFYLPDGKALRVIVIPHALGGLLFAYEDMTDKFVMERSYNTLIAVQKETLDHLREGVAVFGHDGELKLYNPKYAEMWPDEAAVLEKRPRNTELIELSKHMFEYDNWESFKADWTRRPDTKTPLTRRLERTDGMIVDKLVVPLPDGDFLVSYQDVTDRIRAEERLRERNEALEEADRLKTEFLANVSYELRTPLTSIMGFAEVLNELYFGGLSSQQREYIQGITEASNQLMTLINDILDLASMEAGYMTLDVKEFEIYATLSSLMQLVQGRFISAGISLTLDCDKEIGWMLGDEKRIKQIMFNLAGNAMKFTQRGGSVTVGAEEVSGDHIMFWVEDTGVGIAASEKKKVFERFYKSASAIAKQKSGAGLGLSVVKNIVELHGGKVKIESEEGKGTKVMCTFKRLNRKLLAK